MVCEKQHTVCYALRVGLQQLMSEIQYHQLLVIPNAIIASPQRSVYSMLLEASATDCHISAMHVLFYV